MDINAVVVGVLGGSLSGAGTALVAAWLARPKTKAEAEQFHAAANVSVSADAREWTKIFERRADAAELRARRAEDRADEAEQRADACDRRADELEAGLIECYGYVRKQREEIVALGGTPQPLPVRLEALWRTTPGTL